MSGVLPVCESDVTEIHELFAWWRRWTACDTSVATRHKCWRMSRAPSVASAASHLIIQPIRSVALPTSKVLHLRHLASRSYSDHVCLKNSSFVNILLGQYNPNFYTRKYIQNIRWHLTLRCNPQDNARPRSEFSEI